MRSLEIMASKWLCPGSGTSGRGPRGLLYEGLAGSLYLGLAGCSLPGSGNAVDVQSESLEHQRQSHVYRQPAGVEQTAVNLTPDEQAQVTALINACAARDLQALAQLAGHARRNGELPRYFDGPAVFIAHYQGAPWPALFTAIGQSQLADWSRVGYRGVMFEDGRVWLNDSGTVEAFNEVAPWEERLSELIGTAEREALHASLRDAEKPILEAAADNRRVRIDHLADGSYRYAVWDGDALDRGIVAQKPSLVLRNGERRSEGSGGYLTYVFTNGDYRYEVDPDSPKWGWPVVTVILRGEEILSQPLEQRTAVMDRINAQTLAALRRQALAEVGAGSAVGP
ncbi:MAG: hypothetical protein ACYTF0_08830 [Planctomycetota bacterium]|jgi:hypothetical protein